MKLRKCVDSINKLGISLVFPIKNKTEPPSLWGALYPKSKMRWEWDAGGDNRVAGLWSLREELSRSGEVVYTKWFQNRATFFSLEIFPAVLRLLYYPESLSKNARSVLDVLQEESPLSTKELRKRTMADEKTLKELWKQNLIVGFGEVDDGAFPSLAIGSTALLFEDLWHESQKMKISEVEKRIQKLPSDSLFLKYLEKLRKATPSVPTTRPSKKIIRGSDLMLFKR